MILKFFRADPEEYSVIFTSGATGTHMLCYPLYCRRPSFGRRVFPLEQEQQVLLFAPSIFVLSSFILRTTTPFLVFANMLITLVPISQPLEKKFFLFVMLVMKISISIIATPKTRRSIGMFPSDCAIPSLFAYPAEDNFAGVKYPLEWISQIQNGYFNDVRTVTPLHA